MNDENAQMLTKPSTLQKQVVRLYIAMINRLKTFRTLAAKLPSPKATAAKCFYFGYRWRKALFAVAAIGIGLMIGVATTQPRDSLEMLTSVFVIGLFMLIALYHPFGGLLIWLFLYAFIDSWIEIPLGKGIPDLSFGRFAVFALAVSLLMRISTGTMRPLPLSATDLWAFLVPIGIAISAPLAVEPIGTLQSAISMFLLPLAGFVLAKQLVRNRESLNLLFLVLALFGSIAGAHAIYESLTGNIIFISKGQEVTRLYRGETGLRLIEGLIGETGSMGRVLTLTLLTTLYYFMQDKSARFKSFWLVGAVLQFGGIVVTFSRTPLLTFLFGLFILQFFYPTLRRLLIVLALVVGVTLAFNWERIQRTEAAQDRLSGVQDYNGRTYRWQAGFNMWLAKPIRGWGAGRFEQASGRFRGDGSRQNADAVESDYLRILVSSGLVGFLPYALFLLTTLSSSVRLFFRRKHLGPQRFFLAGTIGLAWATLACFLVSSFTATNSVPILRLLPFVLWGAIVGSHQHLLVRLSRPHWHLSTLATQVNVHQN